MQLQDNFNFYENNEKVFAFLVFCRARKRRSSWWKWIQHSKCTTFAQQQLFSLFMLFLVFHKFNTKLLKQKSEFLLSNCCATIFIFISFWILYSFGTYRSLKNQAWYEKKLSSHCIHELFAFSINSQTFEWIVKKGWKWKRVSFCIHRRFFTFS